MSKEYVNTGSGIGYYSSYDIYGEGKKVQSEVHRTTLDGKTYVDVYDENGKKIDSHYT